MRADRRRELLLLEAEHQQVKVLALRVKLVEHRQYPSRVSPVPQAPVQPPPLVAVTREELTIPVGSTALLQEELDRMEPMPPAEEQLTSLLAGPSSTPPSPRSSLS